MKKLIIITPTWNREERMPYMRRFAKLLQTIPDLKWLVIEDGARCDPELEQFLRQCGIDHHYWAIGPTNDKGSVQRNSALEYIVANDIHGVIYNADDDNHYSPRLFDELRTVRKVALLPVGNLGPSGIERPIVRDGRFQRWDAGWLEREYPVDMAGFAFCSSLLHGLAKPIWEHTGVGGESEFLEKIITHPSEIEYLCDGCRTCLVRHNHDLGKPDPRVSTGPTASIDLAFVSLWTPNIAEWCHPFTENKKRYCDEWGHSFHGYDDVLEHDRAPHWSKILALQAHLHDHDWLFWADADCIVANFDIDIRTFCDPDCDLIVARDHNGLNNGTFLIRNTPLSHEYLERVWAKDIRDRFIEQTAMAEVIEEMPHLRTRFLHKRAMNSYWSDYETGDFIFHTPGESDHVKNMLLTVVDKSTRPGRPY